MKITYKAFLLSIFLYLVLSWLRRRPVRSKVVVPVEEKFGVVEPHQSETVWWPIRRDDLRVFDAYNGSTIEIRRNDTDDFHSCYLYHVVNGSQQISRNGSFCYPNLIVSGYRKCSTSALFRLLSSHKHIVANDAKQKENCVLVHFATIIDYFESLPKTVKPNEVILDGCIDLHGNMVMRKLLRNPKTLYVFLLRDYSSWLWAVYNYWCSAEHDKNCNPTTQWVDPAVHSRSPEVFHAIVSETLYGSPHVDSPMQANLPCNEELMLHRWTYRIWEDVPPKHTLLIASEELAADPRRVWRRIADRARLNYSHINDSVLESFSQLRYNTQLTKGAESAVNSSDYQSGLYAASKYRPMLNSTKAMLEHCSYESCVWSSLVTGYDYHCNNTLPKIYSSSQKQKESETVVRGGFWGLHYEMGWLRGSTGRSDTALAAKRREKADAKFLPGNAYWRQLVDVQRKSQYFSLEDMNMLRTYLSSFTQPPH